MIEKLVEIVNEIGIPSAYHHFAEGESPEPPFICYLTPNSHNFAADGKVFYKIDTVWIEVYTDYKTPEVEKQVEDVLDDHEIFYDKSEVWIENEKLYEVVYSFSIGE